MKGTQGKLPLLLGLVVVSFAVIAGGLLVANSSPDGPHLTDTYPIRIGGTMSPGPGAPTDGGTEDVPPPADAASPTEGPDSPQFQPNPPATTSGTSQSAPRPTTQVRPPVQTRPAPAPVPYGDDDDDDDDDSDDYDNDDDD